MRTFVVNGTHHCYGCNRPFPDGDPLAAEEALIEADLRAIADDDAAARGFYALAQRRAKAAGQIKLYLPRIGTALGGDGGVHVVVDGVSLVVPRPLPVEQIPRIMTQAVDDVLLPMLREEALKVLFAQVVPPPAASMTIPARMGHTLDFESPRHPRLGALLGAYPTTTTETMYPHGYARQADGSIVPTLGAAAAPAGAGAEV